MGDQVICKNKIRTKTYKGFCLRVHDSDEPCPECGSRNYKLLPDSEPTEKEKK